MLKILFLKCLKKKRGKYVDGVLSTIFRLFRDIFNFLFDFVYFHSISFIFILYGYNIYYSGLVLFLLSLICRINTNTIIETYNSSFFLSVHFVFILSLFFIYIFKTFKRVHIKIKTSITNKMCCLNVEKEK